MKATIIATIALGAVATGFVAAAPVPSQSNFSLESLAARNFADDDMMLLARAVDMDEQFEPRLLHALGHLFHRHSSNAGQRRDLSEVEGDEEFLAARGILDDNDLKALQSRLIKLVKKLVKKLRTKVHNKVQAVKDDVQAVKDNAKDGAQTIKNGADAAAAANKVAARSFDDDEDFELLARSMGDDEDFELLARSMSDDDEDLERRLAFGLAFKAARFAGKRIAHAVANRHRNHRRSLDGEDLEDFEERSFDDEDNEEFEARDFDALLEGRDDFNML